MSDLIDRQALCNDLREYKVHPVPVSSDESEVKGYNDGIDLAISVISEFPSAEPKEQMAKVDRDVPQGDGECMNCRWIVCDDEIYCAHCGMRLEWK